MSNTFIDKLKKNKKFYDLFKQFIKFIIIGVMNSLISFFTFIILTDLFLINDIIANIISYAVGVINSFIFNKFWTFKSSLMSLKEALLFIVIFLISLSIQLVVYKISKEVFYIHKNISFLISMIVYTSINFTLNKFITFKK